MSNHMHLIAKDLTYHDALHKLWVAFHRGEVLHMRREAWPDSHWWFLEARGTDNFMEVGPRLRWSKGYETITMSARGQRVSDIHDATDWCIYGAADAALSVPYDPIAERNRIGNMIVAECERRGHRPNNGGRIAGDIPNNLDFIAVFEKKTRWAKLVLDERGVYVFTHERNSERGVESTPLAAVEAICTALGE